MGTTIHAVSHSSRNYLHLSFFYGTWWIACCSAHLISFQTSKSRPHAKATSLPYSSSVLSPGAVSFQSRINVDFRLQILLSSAKHFEESGFDVGMLCVVHALIRQPRNVKISDDNRCCGLKGFKFSSLMSPFN